MPVGALTATGPAITATAPATLLSNGTVLIADAVAELYDPTTGAFTPTGSLNTGRGSGDTATLLNDGTVLIVGVNLANAELYDPTTGAFSPTGSLNTGRSGHTATLLNNGTVLIIGGFISNNGSGSLASAELYDPNTGTFTPTGSLNTGRSGHTATLLNNGTVLIIGGFNDNNGGSLASSYLASAELYDPTTGAFTPAGNLNAARADHTATLLNNGTILIAGGSDDSLGSLVSAELYDPNTGAFTPTGNLNTGRYGHTATLLNNGTILITGGNFLPRYHTDSAEWYDATTGTFTLTGSMIEGRSGHTATLLDNGTVLIVGGYLSASPSVAELYELVGVSPRSLLFDPLQPVGTSSASQTVTLSNNESTALTVKSVSISGADSSDFAESDNCVGNLSAGASCTVSVTFAPTAAGTRMGSLAIANNLSPGPVGVQLHGTGVTPSRIVAFSPGSLTFASVVIGATSAAQGITFGNAGNSTLSISNVGISGANASEFAETDNCGGSVAAGASCTINVTFAPSATGTRSGALNIADNATSPQSPQTVTLIGMGQDFALAAPTPTATVTAGQTATYAVSVSPGGGFNQSVSFGCTGAPALSTCSVSPSSVTLNGSTASSVTVTVQTQAASIVFPGSPGTGPLPLGYYHTLRMVLALLALIMMAGMVKRQAEMHRSLATVSLVGFMICVAITLAACGGGGSPSGGGNPGTQTGTYTISVSGAFTSGTTTVTHATNLTLVVR